MFSSILVTAEVAHCKTEYLRLSRLYNPLNLSPASKDLERRLGFVPRRRVAAFCLKKSRVLPFDHSACLPPRNERGGIRTSN